LLEVLQPSRKEPLYRLHHFCFIGGCYLEITVPDDRTGSVAVISYPQFDDEVLNWHWAGQYLVAHKVLGRIDLAKTLNVFMAICGFRHANGARLLALAFNFR